MSRHCAVIVNLLLKAWGGGRAKGARRGPLLPCSLEKVGERARSKAALGNAPFGGGCCLPRQPQHGWHESPRACSLAASNCCATPPSSSPPLRALKNQPTTRAAAADLSVIRTHYSSPSFSPPLSFPLLSLPQQTVCRLLLLLLLSSACLLLFLSVSLLSPPSGAP